MIPEERFGRWVAIGLPLFFIVAVMGAVAIHSGCAVPWREILLPSGLFLGIQIGFYICAFWAGKSARHHNRYWPMPLLVGSYLWATGLVVMHYGSSWGILPHYGGWRDFSVLMFLITLFMWIFAVKFGPRLMKTRE